MFESGIEKYAVVRAEIETGFPVDKNGVIYAACKYCRYFSHSISLCQLSKETVLFPDKYVGFDCPFNKKIKEADDVVQNLKG